MQYRPEIDGLRAIAILPIFIFHLDKEILPGGYLGVDIFFVISGYLITSLILKNINQFSIIYFFNRRIRRILPPLFVLLILTYIFFSFILINEDYKEFKNSIFSSSFFYSNFFFWRNSGYFDVTSELKPLLHTWSLSIEEQFYLFLPLIILFLFKITKNKNKFLNLFLISVLIVISLSFLSIYFLPFLKNTSFFLPHSRFWELLIGSLSAILIKKYNFNKYSFFLIYKLDLIFFFLLISLFFIDSNDYHPGLITLLTTILVSLLIYLSEFSIFLKKILTNKFLIFIGLMSYSLYLYHWPILVFVKYFTFINYNSLDVKIISIFIIFALSYMSFQFIEKPFRSEKIINSKKLIIFLLVFITFPLLISSVGQSKFLFFDNKFYSLNNSFDRLDKKMVKFDNYIDIENSYINGEIIEPNFLIFGDSHAYSSLPVFIKISKDIGINGYFTGKAGCLPFLGLKFNRDIYQKETGCENLNQKTYEFIKNNKNIKKIILISRYDMYLTGGYLKDDYVYHYIDEYFDEYNDSQLLDSFEKSFLKTLDMYNQLGVKVYLLQQVPLQKIDPKKFYFHSKLISKNEEDITNLIYKYSIPKYMVSDLKKNYEKIFKKYSSKFTLVKVLDNFCNQICLIGSSSQSYYYDNDHLSIYGSYKMYHSILKNIFR